MEQGAFKRENVISGSFYCLLHGNAGLSLKVLIAEVLTA